MSNGWINNVLQVNEAKSGNFYVEIKEDITFKAGDRVMLKSKADDIDEQVKNGVIDEDRGEELKDKLSWIKYVGNLAPRG